MYDKCGLVRKLLITVILLLKSSCYKLAPNGCSGRRNNEFKKIYIALVEMFSCKSDSAPVCINSLCR